jgi:hypothetical protein
MILPKTGVHFSGSCLKGVTDDAGEPLLLMNYDKVGAHDQRSDRTAMIGIQLRGRLGNQMFQYAAARTLADQLSCALIIAGHTHGRRFGFVGHLLGAASQEPYCNIQQNSLLRMAFGRGPPFAQGRVVELLMPCLRQFVFHQDFSPRRFDVGTERWEEFDETLFRQSAGTWLTGWFQSELYFAKNKDSVRGWYAASKRQDAIVRSFIQSWPEPTDKMVAVHVRRGDYANAHTGLSDGAAGGMLPGRYYRQALAVVPADAELAVFSDDPDWATDFFRERRPWVSRTKNAAIDMLLMAQCRWVIIANSSFSWWSAWLNARPDKVVIAPKYYLGWNIERWIPGGIEVSGWNYVAAR